MTSFRIIALGGLMALLWHAGKATLILRTDVAMDQIVATAQQAGLGIAMEGFEREMQLQKESSQAAWKGASFLIR